MDFNAFNGMGYFAFVVLFFAVLFGGVKWTSRKKRRAARRAMDEEGYPFLSEGGHAPTSDELRWDDGEEKRLNEEEARRKAV